MDMPQSASAVMTANARSLLVSSAEHAQPLPWVPELGGTDGRLCSPLAVLAVSGATDRTAVSFRSRAGVFAATPSRAKGRDSRPMSRAAATTSAVPSGKTCNDELMTRVKVACKLHGW